MLNGDGQKEVSKVKELGSGRSLVGMGLLYKRGAFGIDHFSYDRPIDFERVKSNLGVLILIYSATHVNRSWVYYESTTIFECRLTGRHRKAGVPKWYLPSL